MDTSPLPCVDSVYFFFIIIILQHSHLALYFANVQCTSTKTKTLLFNELEARFVCGTETCSEELPGGSSLGGVQYRPMKTHTSDDT